MERMCGFDFYILFFKIKNGDMIHIKISWNLDDNNCQGKEFSGL
jgi:hypothetical protein